MNPFHCAGNRERRDATLHSRQPHPADLGNFNQRPGGQTRPGRSLKFL